MNIRQITISIIFSLISISANASDWLKPFSSWGNEVGSTLYVESVGQDGKIAGYYINEAPSTHCKNKPYPVTGWVYGANVTFSVKWENSAESCQSVTGWTGYYSGGKITTKWYLAYGETFMNGQDVFKPISPKIKKSLIH
jgi:hypothetical protein